MRTLWAIFSHFWAGFGTYRGLRGKKGLFVMSGLRLIPLFVRFGGKKRLFWGTKYAVLGGHLPIRGQCRGAPLVSFWLKI